MLARGSGPFVAVTLILFFIFMVLRIMFGITFLIFSIAFLIILIIFLVFFRDPKRNIGKGIVAPADGVIREIKEYDSKVRISTFMNIHNVHVNRTPLDGKVVSVEYKRGKFKPAYRNDAENNEQVTTILDTTIGQVKIVQIAGIIARRIVIYIKNGEDLSKGQRIGIIRFGSRVDVYLPKEKINITVKVGMKVNAGETTVADLNV